MTLGPFAWKTCTVITTAAVQKCHYCTTCAAIVVDVTIITYFSCDDKLEYQGPRSIGFSQPLVEMSF